MIAAKSYDLVVKNVRVVRPHRPAVDFLDIGIKDGRFIEIAPHISVEQTKEVFDGRGLLGFPGVVDSHMHVGIYNSLDQDAKSESQAAAMGGVTTSITYIRTGHYYLNRGGAYGEFFPEVLNLSEGNYHVDYAYHLVPMNREHIGEMESLLLNQGVCSFKIFMFYGGHGLHGRSNTQKDYLMIGENDRYDVAHFEQIMREVKRLSAKHPELAPYLSVSLHCETAEILDAYTKAAESNSTLSGLPAYSAARPPHSEGLAVMVAAYLAQEAECQNINLLHLSSQKALDAALQMEKSYPMLNIRKEVTVSHLIIDENNPHGNLAKVNPPLRTRQDVDYLWQALLERKLDWIGSDHACCPKEQKIDAKNPDNVFKAKAGYGGTQYLLPAIFSEGSKRGMSYHHMAEVLCWNPAQRFGLNTKGDIAEGYDADLVLVDPTQSWMVNPEESPSTQGYSPFGGLELTGQVKTTFLRGKPIFDQGKIIGSPQGQFIRRPTQRRA